MGFNISERYVIGLNILLIALIAYLAARSVGDVFALRLASSAVPAESETVGATGGHAAGARSRPYYDAIVRRDMFNLAPAPVAAVAPAENEDLQLTLLGTSHLTEGRPFAIIQDSSQNQSLYRLGDTIPNAGKLIEVTKDRVVVLHNGHRVAVEMAHQDMPGAEQPFGIPGRHGRHGLIPRGRLIPRGPLMRSRRFGATGVQKLGGNHYLIARTTLNQDLQDMPKLFTEIRAVPNLQNGTANGFRLSEVEPGSIFQQIGLMDGDLLTAVSGQPVGDPARAMQLFEMLRSQSTITLNVVRNGSPMQLQYVIR
jgi:general secretion pathway protein C